MKNIFLFSLLTLVIVGAISLFQKKYHLCLVVLILCLFFLYLILRKIKNKHVDVKLISIISTVIAVASVSRILFFATPQIKPLIAIIIISGICLGSKAGLEVGAMSILVSNFFFGQGIWTLWQMSALGIIGLIAGIIFKFVPNKTLYVCIYGAAGTMFYGLLVNVLSFYTLSNNLSVLYCLSSLPMDIINSVSTVIFLIIFNEPLTRQLKRALQ